MAAEPRAELLDLPRVYGTPQAPLHWAAVRARLTAAEHYWLATVRQYGYGPAAQSYAKSGVWRLRPERVLSWQRFPSDATRFVFGDG